MQSIVCRQRQERLKERIRGTYCRLITSRIVRRRFHALCVGPPKTGTVSLAKMFGRWRTSHEAETWWFLPKLNRYLIQQEFSDDEFTHILAARDRRLWLEMDSAHYYVFCLHLMVPLFPDARFILTVRDPISWLDSYINHTTGELDPSSPWTVYRKFRMGDNASAHSAHEGALARHHLHTLEGYFSYWSRHYDRVLNTVPANRLLVIETSHIQDQAKDLASFVGVPDSSLLLNDAHSHKAFRKLGVLCELERSYLSAKCLQYCEATMRRVYPQLDPGALVEAAMDRIILRGG